MKSFLQISSIFMFLYVLHYYGLWWDGFVAAVKNTEGATCFKKSWKEFCFICLCEYTYIKLKKNKIKNNLAI